MLNCVITLKVINCQLETEFHKDYLVTVIVPVYNVRKYIARCVGSLMEQTLNDVEFIFVNDASSDDSISTLKCVLEKYPQRQADVTILTHAKNKGLPAARNTGLFRATGRYIYHCDSDDYVEPSMLQDMYECAINSNADIVWADWFLSMTNNERYMPMLDSHTPQEAIKAMLSGGMKYNVWNKLVCRKLYADNDISFPTGYGMGEDLTMIKLFAFANKVVHLPKAYYHYNKTNSTAFSQTYSDRHLIELHHNIDDMSKFVSEHFGDEYECEVAFLKLEAKFPFLLSPNWRKVKKWKLWYPEANRFIMQNRYISTRNRMLQLWAAKDFWLLVRIYNFLFNKIIYGIIFK